MGAAPATLDCDTHLVMYRVGWAYAPPPPPYSVRLDYMIPSMFDRVVSYDGVEGANAPLHGTGITYNFGLGSWIKIDYLICNLNAMLVMGQPSLYIV